GDGFFLGSDVPYAYVPGEDGVEVLEFRTANSYDFRMLANNPAYWDKALANLLAARVNWPKETTPPSGMLVD
ncbi:MAG: cupin domain-containing protein, partial [Novosphingobium sp.]